MALQVVGIGDCRISQDPSDVLVTHALGSCIAVVLWEPLVRVAGLLHYMLPESRLDLERAAKSPFLFADTGISLLLKRAYQLGAMKSRLIVMAAGGAQMLHPAGDFHIGQRNHAAMQKVFGEEGIHIHREEIGGINWRTVRVAVASGQVQLWTPGQGERDMLSVGGILCLR